MQAELDDAWKQVRDDDDIWVGVITGAGDGAFSAGSDLKWRASQTDEDIREHSRAGVQEAEAVGFQRGSDCWKPLVAMINGFIGWGGGLLGFEGLTLETIVGYLFWPLAWAMGVPAAECADVGRLLGMKTILNEFIAYQQLGGEIAMGQLTERSRIIASYALCGFANFGSLAILLGGIAFWSTFLVGWAICRSWLAPEGGLIRIDVRLGLLWFDDRCRLVGGT
jgi:hypothetical protein